MDLKWKNLFWLLYCITFFLQIGYADSQEYIAVKPEEAVLQPEGKIAFMVGLVKDGQVQVVMPWEFKFSADYGTFAGNVFTAPKEPGTYFIRARYQKLVGLARVSVKPEEDIAKIEIIASSTKLDPGTKIVLESKTIGVSGKVLSFHPAWAITAGPGKGSTIEGDGTFEAGSIPGEHTITAFGPSGIEGRIQILVQGSITEPPPVATNLEIRPQITEIRTTETVALEAIVYDQKGQKLDADIAWSAIGGIITPEGKFIAGDEAGEFVITASAGNLSQMLRGTILLPTPILTQLRIEPNSAILEVGKQRQFQCTTLDQYGKPIAAKMLWQADGGNIISSVDSESSMSKAVFIAGKTPGKYTIIAKSGQCTAQASIEIILEPSNLAMLKLVPDSVNLEPGKQAQLQCAALDQYNKPIEAKIVWQADGGAIATMDANGTKAVFTAGKTPGKYTIIAKSGQCTAQASLEIVPEPSNLAMLKLVPDSMIVEVGKQAQLQCTALDQYNKPIEAKIVWQADGVAITKMDATGAKIVFIAGKTPGKYTIVAKSGQCTAQASLEIVLESSNLAMLKLVPDSMIVEVGKQAQLQCTALDQYNKPIVAKIVWQADGGNIISSADSDSSMSKAVFIAGKTPGKYTIIAKSGECTAQASLEIVPEASTLAILKLMPDAISLEPGKQVQLQCTTLDQYNKPIVAKIVWQADGGAITSMDTNGTKAIFAAGKKTGKYTIVAKSGQYTAQASVEIVPEPSTLAMLKLIPDSMIVEVEKQSQFQCMALDQYNKPIEAQIVWQADGGAITSMDANGTKAVFAAGKKTGKYTIVAKSGQYTARASVEIIPEPSVLTTLKLIPDTIILEIGKKAQLQCTAFDQYDKQMDAQITWQAEGGYITEFTYEGSMSKAVFVAGKTPGKYSIVAKSGQCSSKVLVELVRPEPVLTKLEITPANAKVKVGETCQFQLQALDQFAEAMEVQVQWETKGGTMQSNGQFVAGNETGQFTLVVTDEKTGTQAKALIVILPSQEYYLKISPEKVSVGPGEKIRFDASLYRNDREQLAWAWDFTFLAQQGEFLDNIYTAPVKPGTYKITIRHPKAVGTATVIVQDTPITAVPTKIAVDSKEIRLRCGAIVPLKAIILDQNDKPLDLPLQWQIQGGSWAKEQQFKAGDVPGTYQIKIVEPNSGLQETISLIVEAQPVAEYTINVNPSEIIILPGKQQTVQLTLLHNQKPEWTWAWDFTVVPSEGTYQDGVYTAPMQPGKYSLEIRHPKAKTQIPIYVIGWKIVPNQAIFKSGEKKQFQIEGQLQIYCRIQRSSGAPQVETSPKMGGIQPEVCQVHIWSLLS